MFIKFSISSWEMLHGEYGSVRVVENSKGDFNWERDKERFF